MSEWLRMAVLAAGLSALGVAAADARQNATCPPTTPIIRCSTTGTARSQLQDATFIAGSAATGETLARAIAIEVATAPFGSSSGGFTFTLNTATREWRRTAGTFGPAFSERALTIGEGKLSAGFNFLHRSYDRFGNLDLAGFEAFRFQGGNLAVNSSRLELETKTDTFAGFAHYGILNNLDVGIVVPYIRLSLSGTSRIYTPAASEIQRVSLDSTESGFGDVAIFGKYRFKQFGPEPAAGAPPNGAVAAAVTVRLPTGDEDGLRGLGVGRVLFAVIGSASAGRFSPHANFGYELWTSGVDSPQDFQDISTVTGKDQIQYAGGLEFEMTPRFTLVGDVVGRYLRGAGKLGYQPYRYPPNRPVSGAEALVAIPEGMHSALLAPGLKWNFLQNALLTVNALISVTKQGLRDRVTPVVGIDWGF